MDSINAPVIIYGDFKLLFDKCKTYVTNATHSIVHSNYAYIKGYRLLYYNWYEAKFIEIKDYNYEYAKMLTPPDWRIRIHEDRVEAYHYHDKIPDIDCVLNIIKDELCDIDYFN